MEVGERGGEEGEDPTGQDPEGDPTVEDSEEDPEEAEDPTDQDPEEDPRGEAVLRNDAL